MNGKRSHAKMLTTLYHRSAELAVTVIAHFVLSNDKMIA